MKRIVICVDCKELKIHSARGMCQRCYGRWKYYHVVNKKKMKKTKKRYVELNRYEHNLYMRVYMRKKIGVKNPTKFTAQELINGV